MKIQELLKLVVSEQVIGRNTKKPLPSGAWVKENKNFKNTPKHSVHSKQACPQKKHFTRAQGIGYFPEPNKKEEKSQP